LKPVIESGLFIVVVNNIEKWDFSSNFVTTE